MSSKFKALGAFGTTILFCAITQCVTKGTPGKKKPAGKVTLSQALRAKRHEKKRAQRGALASINNTNKKDLMSSFKKDVNNIHYHLGIRNNMLTLFISGTGVVTKEDIDELDGQIAKFAAVNVLDNTIEIGDEAFSSIKDLRRVEGKMHSIGEKAFYSCNNLTYVEFSKDLTKIKEAAFEGCKKLKEIIIPENVTSIDKYAFCGCKNLEKVTFQSSKIEVIHEATFQGTGLKEIIIPENITSIEGYAFCGCENLEKVTFQSSKIKVIHEATFQETGLKEITIPNGVEIIGSYAFKQCGELTKVTLPQSCYYLADYAFEDCKLLQEINLEHVQEISEDGVFSGCELLNESARSRIDKLLGDYFGS